MNITVSLRHGPLNIEIEAEDEEDYRQEILDLAEFLKENEEEFDDFGTSALTEQDSPTEEKDETEQVSLNFSGESNETEEDTNQFPEGPLSPVADDLRVEENLLEEILDADIDGEKSPILLLNDTEILGEVKKDRQRKAALILLYVWNECNGVERVSSSDLKEALEDSDISSNNMFHMYDNEGKRYFDQTGTGASASVALRRPGTRQARKEIKNLLEELNIV